MAAPFEGHRSKSVSIEINARSLDAGLDPHEFMLLFFKKRWSVRDDWPWPLRVSIDRLRIDGVPVHTRRLAR